MGTGYRVSDVLKTLTGSISKFVLAWLLPSVITLGLTTVFVLPHIKKAPFLKPVLDAGAGSPATGALVFSLLAVSSAVLFAYASLPIYRVLEGYALPGPLRRWLLRRQLRRWTRLQAAQRRFELTGRLVGAALSDELLRYPGQREFVQATRLGNALRAMERFGVEAYGLDSQTLWYELLGVVPEGTRRDVEESRSPVDFFVSAITHAIALASVCVCVGVASDQPTLVVLGLVATASIPISYRLAVNNVLDWGLAVKAVVNLGRKDLAAKLSLDVPAKIEWERNMWAAYVHAIEKRDRSSEDAYDTYRIPELSARSGP